jgi:hypothetical protein
MTAASGDGGGAAPARVWTPDAGTRTGCAALAGSPSGPGRLGGARHRSWLADRRQPVDRRFADQRVDCPPPGRRRKLAGSLVAVSVHPGVR